MDLDAQLKSLERKLDKISKVETDKAFSSAINKVAAQSRTAVASEVARETRVKVSVIKRRIFIKRARPQTGQALIRLYAKPIDAIDARISRMAKGWRVSGEFKERSFMAKMPNQGRHRIYQRKGRERLPIKKVVVPISDPVQRIGKAVIEYKMKKDFHRILKQEFNARINGYVKRTG